MKLLREHHMTTFKGLIFDIKRFAIHDGDGIRTTIFLKGCPLHCLWCQNPEGISFRRQPIFMSKLCIHCQSCVRFARDGQIEYHHRPYFHKEYQGNYDNLVKMCPSGAIRYDSDYYSVDELMKKIKEDRVFYRNNGGVTFSGGEPFGQAEFLIEMLKQCHRENIHTAIETTVSTSLENIKQALPYLDQIYIDLKINDEIQHQKYVGGSLKVIKDNIKYILESEHKHKVIMRTPLIPEITATTENISSIARYLSQIYPDVTYELLNYNPLAPAKYEYVDFDYGVNKDAKKLTTQQMEELYQIVYQNGIKNLIKEGEHN